jgi:hypothetical protein
VIGAVSCALRFNIYALGFAVRTWRFGVLLHTCSCKLVWWVLDALHLFIDGLAECVALSAFTRRLTSWYTSDWLYSRGGRMEFRASRLVIDTVYFCDQRLAFGCVLSRQRSRSVLLALVALWC